MPYQVGDGRFGAFEYGEGEVDEEGVVFVVHFLCEEGQVVVMG